MSKDNKAHISQAEANRILEYRDGKLYWKIRSGYAIRVGSEAGTVNAKGYRIISYDKRMYRAHHLVYLMFNGVFPKQVDHVNGAHDDNRIENLRVATDSENQWNRGANANSTTGHKNVKWIQRLQKYVVAIAANAKSHHIGVYANLQDAIKAASNARNQLHGNFARSV